jgi:exodeoxyribonuclease VII small subunit
MQTLGALQSPQNQEIPQVTTSRKRAPDLEKSLAALETIVQQLEDGDIPLEDALKQFEKGVKLSRDCQTALRAAEQRVKILLDGDLKDLEEAPDAAD